MPQTTLYADHAATTPLDPRVFEAMVPYLKDQFGNASSVHTLGRKARFAVEDARDRVAGHLGAEPSEIIFTSGATEANNTALKGVLFGHARGHLVTSAAEHEAVLRPAENLVEEGYLVTTLAPGPDGAVAVEALVDALTPETRLVSIMYVNNEVGTINSVSEMASVCRKNGVLFHCDAVQAMGLLQPQVDDLDVDLMALSAHKFYGPKGIGALFVRGGVELHPLVLGGAQERGRRGGTENVAAIVGLAKAMDLAAAEAADRHQHIQRLQGRLRHQLEEVLEGLVLFNTPLENVAPHILNVSFPPEAGRALDGEMLLLNLDMQGIYASSGSACTSGAIEPSHVLLAMGRSPETAAATVRFSLGKDNTEAEIDIITDRLAAIIRRMRKRVNSVVKT